MDTEPLDIEDLRPPADGAGVPARVSPLVWVALALVALLAGFLVLNRGGPPERTAAPAPTPALFVPPTPSPGPNQRQYLGVTQICAPVTDGRRTLASSFEVTNVSDYRVSIDSMAGVLPQGGLHRHGAATQGGDCETAGRLPSTGSLAPGESRFFTLRFDLPRSCPARYPVQVRIGLTAAGFSETSLSLLYSDLSVPDFSTCGPGEAKAGTTGWFIP